MGDASTLPRPASRHRLVPPVLSGPGNAAEHMARPQLQLWACSFLLQASIQTLSPVTSSCNAEEPLELFCLQDHPA